MKQFNIILALFFTIIGLLLFFDIEDSSNRSTTVNKKDRHQQNQKTAPSKNKEKKNSSHVDENSPDLINWNLNNKIEPAYLLNNDELSLLNNDDFQKKNQYEKLESIGFLVSKALDLTAKEIGIFYSQYQELPPSSYLHFFLESYGGVLWSVQQSVQIYSDSFDWDKSIESFLKDYQRKSNSDWIGISHTSFDHKHVFIILTAPQTMFLSKTPKFHEVDQNYTLKGNINQAFDKAHLVIAKPDGSFYEIKAEELAVSTQGLQGSLKKIKQTYPFGIELIFDQKGIWDIEVLAEGGFGPQPLGQIRFYVGIKAEKSKKGTLVERNSLNHLDSEGQFNQLQALEQEALALLNRDREVFDLPPLVLDSHLSIIATAHSEDMNQNGFFGHTSPHTGTMGDRLKEGKYRSIHSGENIALNQSLSEAELGLMYSIGHRQNILSKDFTHVGIGISMKDKNIYLTQLFAKKAPIYSKKEYPNLVQELFDKINEKRAKLNQSPLILSPKLNQIAGWRIEQNAKLDQLLEQAKTQNIYGKMSVSGITLSEIQQFEVGDDLLQSNIKEIGIAVYQKVKFDEPDLKVVVFTRAD